MRVLLIDAYDQTDINRNVVNRVTTTLSNSGHTVTQVAVASHGFTSPMSEAERRSYHDEGSNILVDEVRSATAQVRDTDALLFCYPSLTFTVPAALKNWFDRVLLPGVAFTIDDEGKLRPALKYISRIGVITTTPHSVAATRRARDGGRRMIMWTLRMQCGVMCRRTYLRLPSGRIDGTRIDRAFASW